MKTTFASLVIALALAASPPLHAQVPQLLNYQGRVAVGSVNFNGSGQFRFALVDTAGTTTYWSNDGSSSGGSQPTNAVTLAVTKGLYSVLLGDTSLTNMTAIPTAVFSNADVRLRVWFNDGVNGSQLLTPDQRLAAAGYAMMAAGLQLPATTGATSGVIAQNGTSLIHTFGSNNYFAGAGAGNFTLTGSDNVVVGSTALASNTTGHKNVAIGSQALNANTTGLENVAVGFQTLLLNQTGNQSTALGNDALANSTSAPNTAVGYASLSSVTTGVNNTAIGYSTLRFLTGSTSNSNTALGNNAGISLTSGSGNIFVGTAAGINLTSGSNNLDIGNGGVVGDSGVIRVGTAQTSVFVAGVMGVTTGNNNAVPVVIDSNGQLGTISSSRRYKEDIADMNDASARIFSLRPVTFHYKKPYANGSKPLQFGLIAEEVAQTFPELAVFNNEGQPETVKYHDLAPLLLNEVQKEHHRADEKDKEIAKLKEENTAMKQRLSELEANDKEREARLTRLEQFLPKNPESTVTTAANTKGE